MQKALPIIAVSLLLLSGCQGVSGTLENSGVVRLPEKVHSDYQEVQEKCEVIWDKVEIATTETWEEFKRCLENLGNEGNTHALVRLAYVYVWGQGDTEQSPTKASELYLRAAELDNPEAQDEIARRYMLGHDEEWGGMDNGVGKDLKESLKWYLKAAAHGYTSAEASLGGIYAEGLGIPTDSAKAIEWYTKAAMKGSSFGLRPLAKLHQERGDLVQWYAWRNIQKASGRWLDWEVQSFEREIQESGMTPTQIVEAQRISSELFEIIQKNKTDYCNEFRNFDNITCPWEPSAET